MTRLTVRGFRTLYDDGDTVVLGRKGARDSGGLMSERVELLEYRHIEDADHVVRYHNFRPGVHMVALPGRRAVLLSGSRPIWGDL